jgi:hypothetical protein
MADSLAPERWWATATATRAADGRVVVFRYRMSEPDGCPTAEFQHALEVRWPYEGGSNRGMPPPSVNDQQFHFEEAIESLTEGTASYLMLVATGDGEKRWLFYVRDPDEWIANLNELLRLHPPYPLDLPHWHEPGWETWREFARSVEGKT